MPVSADVLFTFLLASVVMLIVPGPAITVIVANSLAHGTRAGFLNIAGIQAGLVIIIAGVAIGLATLLETMSVWFDWLRIIGAGYLIWIGYKLFTARAAQEKDTLEKSDSGFFWQGFTVILTNPKAHLLFGAFLPQFVDPAGDAVRQVVFLGAVFMVAAMILDGIYAIAAGRAGHLLSAARSRVVSRISGGLLMGGGVWLATLRQP